MRIPLTLLLLVVCAPLGAAEKEPVLDPSIAPFVERFCIDCHDAESEKGDRNLEPFLDQPNAGIHHDTLREILDQLNLGEMPPKKKKSVAQPSSEERRRVTAALTEYLIEIDRQAGPDASVLRRLTRHEYNNTLRQLLGVHPEASDATSSFPVETLAHGFPNIGEAQVLSDHQLGLYLDAAQHYVDQAVAFGLKKPAPRTWTFAPKDFVHERNTNNTVWYRILSQDQQHLDIGHGEPVDRYPSYPKQFARTGVHAAGTYRIRVKACAVGRENRYDRSLFQVDLDMPLKMGFWHVPDRSLLERGASEGRVFIEAVDLPDDQPAEFEVTAWMPKGSIPYVHWINGEGSSKPILTRTQERYHPETWFPRAVDLDDLRAKGKDISRYKKEGWTWISDVYEGPRVRVFEMTLEGPLDETWPPPGHQTLFGTTMKAGKVDILSTMATFAARAFRQPVARNEVSHYADFVLDQIAAGRSHADALKLGLVAILTSPRFLFLDEGDPEAQAHLDAWQLASRLSYTLWSSMPDIRLFEKAENGSLQDKKVLLREIQRMLDSPQSEAFAEHFTDAWLRLDKLGSMPPGATQYPTYYRERLESAMKQETRLFFAHMIAKNRPVTEILTATYSFLNDALAKHYGVQGVDGEHFRRVALPSGIHRGGLLGHASVLTATANGVETSPVVRGVWLLESILGTPPQPPPPDVPPIEPDTRGATTIREQLAKHRQMEACNDCHANIDPWGFALEFFDPIGGYREVYPLFRGTRMIRNSPQNKRIDGSGTLPSGEIVNDDVGLRQALATRRRLFTRNLAVKMGTYATGRAPRTREFAEIDLIVDEIIASGGGTRDLLVRVLASEWMARR